MRSRHRITVLALVALPLVALAVLVVEAIVAVNRDYIREPELDVEFTTSGCNPPLQMAVLGDSTVAGLGATSERTSLPGQVALKVAEATGRAVSVMGYGVSGAATRDVLEQQLPLLTKEQLDVIVIEIGSNDVTHGTRLVTVARLTRDLLERAKRLAPIVVLGSSGRLNSPNFLQPLRWVVMLRATSVRKRQGLVARELEVPFVDISRDVSPTYDRTPGANSRDAFHPSDIGYEIWARPLAERVIHALNPTAASCSSPNGDV